MVLDCTHDSRPKAANAGGRLRQEEATTAAAGVLNADPSGSDATGVVKQVSIGSGNSQTPCTSQHQRGAQS